MALIFLFNLGEQEVLLQNSERSACDLQLFWAYRKLIETKNGKRSYGRFVNVVIGVIIISLLLVFCGKVGVFILVFVLRVVVFRVIIFTAMLYMNYRRCGDCAFSASFVRECTDVSYFAEEGVELNVLKESVVVEEIKEVQLRSRRVQFIYERNYNLIGLQPRGHTPNGLPEKKLRRLLHKRRKVRVFVWNGILNNIISYYFCAFTINPQPLPKRLVHYVITSMLG